MGLSSVIRLHSMNFHQHRATIAYTAPFVAFLAMLGIERALSLPAEVYYPIRLAIVLTLLIALSRRVIPWRPSAFWASTGIGIVVFLVWIAPDAIFNYRHTWLFQNSITGAAESSVPVWLRARFGFVAVRVFGCVVAVPLLEELFWRGWLMRWLVDTNFLKVPLAIYVPKAFWVVALMFASEHGPYWEVGLVAGIIYNWWVIRTGNLADAILAHAVTNGLLSAWVLYTGRWEYWL
jgi:uncharacterized protein